MRDKLTGIKDIMLILKTINENFQREMRLQQEKNKKVKLNKALLCEPGEDVVN